MPAPYVRRFADETLPRLMAALPALLLVGPRATGKTTTARRYAAGVVRLDHRAESAAFAADPDAALRTMPEPLLLDEWQAVPEVLGAVKRAVDDDSRPGRFLLTGSVRADLDAQTWPGTGRLVRVPMFGLTQRELAGRTTGPGFIDQLRPELTLGTQRARLYHLREKNGRREVDLLAELAAHHVVALEVKATASPRPDDARHLSWLRDQLGDRFVAGAVLHTGPAGYALGERIFALPSRTWGGLSAVSARSRRGGRGSAVMDMRSRHPDSKA